MTSYYNIIHYNIMMDKAQINTINILSYYIKLKTICLCDCHTDILVMTASIELGLAQMKLKSFWTTKYILQVYIREFSLRKLCKRHCCKLNSHKTAQGLYQLVQPLNVGPSRWCPNHVLEMISIF